MFVVFFHAYFAGVGVECHKQSFDHYYRSVDDDTEVDGPHGNQVGTHSLYMETDKGKEQRQRHHNGHVDGSTPVGHEQKYDDGHQDKSFDQVVQHGVYRYVNQVGTVVVWYNLDILWQLCLYVGHFLLQQRNDSTRVVTAVHQYHTFHYIVLVADAALSESGQTRFLHGSYILDKDRRAVDILHHHVLKVLDVGNQSDAAYYVGLCPFVHDVASYVEVTFLYGIIQFQVGDSVAVKLVRIDLHLKCLYFAAEAHHVGHARYGAQLSVEHPVLQGLQFPDRTLVALQGVTVNLTRRACGRLHFGRYAIGKVGPFYQVVHLLAGERVVHMVIKEYVDHRQSEQGGASYDGLLLYRVHG